MTQGSSHVVSTPDDEFTVHASDPRQADIEWEPTGQDAYRIDDELVVTLRSEFADREYNSTLQWAIASDSGGSNDCNEASYSLEGSETAPFTVTVTPTSDEGQETDPGPERRGPGLLSILVAVAAVAILVALFLRSRR